MATKLLRGETGVLFAIHHQDGDTRVWGGGEDFLTPPIFYGVHIPSWSVVGMRMVRGLKKKKRAADDED